MALNDILVPKENAQGTFDETVLTPAEIGAVSTSRQITAGTGLTGGGDLTANRTLTVSYGSSAGTACEGNDPRLSDSRTPSSHTHGNLTNDGKIGTTSGLPLKTGTNGVIEAGSFGTAAGTFAEGNHTHDIITSASGVNKFKLGLGGDSPTGRFVGVTTAGDPLVGIFSYEDTTTYDPNDEVGSSQYGMTIGANSSNAFIQYLQAGGVVAEYDFPPTSGTVALTSDFAAPPAIGSTTRNSGAFTTLTANNGIPLTASAPVLDLGQTWNNAATTFTALRINVTNTASSSSSLLIDATSDGGTQYFRVRRDGQIQASRSSATVDAIFVAQGRINCAGNVSSNNHTVMDSIGFNLSSDRSILWSSTTSYGGTPDLILLRDAAGTLGQRNGTNAQTFRIYNTFIDANNHERGFLRWSSNVFQIGTEKGSGGGTARALEFQTDGTTRLTLGSSGTINANGTMICVDLQCSTLLVTGGSVTAASTGALRWNGRARFNSPADSIVTIVNAANTDFDRLQFGGTTSSFPALKRSSTVLQARLADDSGYTTIDANHRLQGTAPATSGAAGTAGDIRYDADYIYVCTAASTWKRAAIATW